MEPYPPRMPTPPPFNQAGEMPPMRYGPPKTSLGAKLKKIFGPVAVVFVIILKFFANLKFIILPLLKFLPVLLKTGGSMILMIGVYGMLYGWKWAIGFVVLLFV